MKINTTVWCDLLEVGRRRGKEAESADSGVACLAGADADALRQVDHEDLAVADLPRLRAAQDGIHRGLHEIIVHRDVEPYFRYQVKRYFLSAV